jgi:hypothetical protein
MSSNFPPRRFHPSVIIPGMPVSPALTERFLLRVLPLKQHHPSILLRLPQAEGEKQPTLLLPLLFPHLKELRPQVLQFHAFEHLPKIFSVSLILAIASKSTTVESGRYYTFGSLGLSKRFCLCRSIKLVILGIKLLNKTINCFCFFGWQICCRL